ncbi:GMC oxidoreductase [Ceratobasidium sp. AG-Ba]|nr:GMC oxidoreductase [Ceratobasidium sp. AG-Ba]
MPIAWVEAYDSGLAVDFTLVPAGFGKIMKSKYDWGLYTVPQKNCNDRELFWTRGSSSNAMMFHYGAPTDYDEWSKATDEPEGKEWEFEHFQEWLRKFEKFYPHPDFPLDESRRGTDDRLQRELLKCLSVICGFMSSIGIPHNPDFNTSRLVHIDQLEIPVRSLMLILQWNTWGLKDDDIHHPYIHQVLRRGCLSYSCRLGSPKPDCGDECSCDRILFDGKRAVGVEFARNKEGPRYQVRTRKEVILCAGAVHTPHILMNSGVGPAEELNKHHIPVVQDSPGVGDHLMDHQAVAIRFPTVPGESLNYLNPAHSNSIYDKLRRIKAIGQYLFFSRVRSLVTLGKQRASCALMMQTSFPDFPRLAKTLLLVLARRHRIDLHADWVAKEHEERLVENMMSIIAIADKHGENYLRSNDPFDAPVIDPNYLGTQHDVDVMVRAIRTALRLTQAEPLRNIIDNTSDTLALDKVLLEADDAALVRVARQRVETIYHPTSTARIGSVVDTKLKVYGLDGLRIADCSVIPTIISGHTTASALAIGEKAADMIKAANPAPKT